MLLTITTTRRPATVLSQLLQIDPDDVRTRRFPFAEALVFFPQYDPDRCTAAVLLQPPPERIRTAVSPSHLAVVLASIFDPTLRLARGGGYRCGAAAAWPFEVQVPGLLGQPGEKRARRLFGPLGYEVDLGADGSLWLSGTTELADLLAHLCVLLPLLDEGPPPDLDNVDRLLAKGDPWLVRHPECALVAEHYLGSSAAVVSLTDRHGNPPAAQACSRRATA